MKIVMKSCDVTRHIMKSSLYQVSCDTTKVHFLKSYMYESTSLIEVNLGMSIDREREALQVKIDMKSSRFSTVITRNYTLAI